MVPVQNRSNLEGVLLEECQLDPKYPVVAGVSGGADSLCLLGVLQDAGFRVIVGHFDHRLRPESGDEAAAVAELAKTLGLPYVGDTAEVEAWATEQSLSIEEAARSLRYKFLFATARKEGAQAVAVGHTADDQVETVLMHFLRGAGLAGLKGMERRVILPVFDEEIPLVRPLLGLWRADTEAYCLEHRLSPHQDASNLDEKYFRNRLRHRLIPILEEYNPRFKQALVRTALVLQGEAAILEAELEAAWELVVSGQGEGWVAFEARLLRGYLPGMQRGLVRKAAERLRLESRDIGYEALERARKFIAEGEGKQVDLVNGLYLMYRDEKILLARYEAELPGGDFPRVSGEMELRVGGCLEMDQGWVLEAELCSAGEEAWAGNNDPFSAWLDAEACGGKLQVRGRRRGDMFQPLGMGGQTVKVREFYINQKLPKQARDGWPLVCALGKIAWIAGFRMGHTFRVTKKTGRVIRLRLRKK